jgi:3-deoxy-D-manno-octulosonic-acid transferase
MRRLYSALLWLILPLHLLGLVWRGLREPEYWRGGAQRFGFGFQSDDASAGCVWIHAVSMGEVQAAAPLVAALHERGQRVLLTATTPTGRRRAQQLCGTIAMVRYAPLDFSAGVMRVLRAARPRLLIVMETELWPNLLHACARAQIPVLVASARLSARTAARLARWPGLLSAPALANLHIAAQTSADADRYRSIGVPDLAVRVLGNLKFDSEIPAGTLAGASGLRHALGSERPLWVAGSTHPVEEDAVLEAHRQLCRQRPALLVLAPRHPQRFDELASRLRTDGWQFVRRSAGVSPDSTCQVLLLDTMGELADFYAAADLAYVGGSLVPVGGHNLLEPVMLGVATITGPLHTAAPEVFAALRDAGALAVVEDAAALAGQVANLLASQADRARLIAAGGNVLRANRGSLKLITDWAMALSR